MGFSEKMRESIGAEGAKIEVAPPNHVVSPGDVAKLVVTIQGGSKPAVVDGLVVRLVEAQRHWVDKDGNTRSEQSVADEADRSALTAGWTRSTTTEMRIDGGFSVEAGARHGVDVELTVPSATSCSSAACTHTLSVSADIKGQIDPTGHARLQIG